MTGDERSSGGSRVDRRRFLQSAGVATATVAVGATAVAGQQNGSGVSSTDITIESWDGTELATTLFTPAESGPQPAIMMTHGWGANRSMSAPAAERYARNGYVVLTYDSRGFGNSGGVVGLNGPNEVQDGQHLIEWLARRDEVALDGEANPRLGMDGLSYAGGIQLMLAANDDRVDAVVPRITWNDLRYSLAPNGVLKTGWMTVLLLGGSFGTGADTELDPRLWEHYEQATSNNEVPQEMIDLNEDRSFAYNHENFDTPTFLFQGWDDGLFKPNEAAWTYQTLQRKGVDSRICFHRGGHALQAGSVQESEQEYMDDLALSWLDRHLRDAEGSIEQAHAWDRQNEEFFTDDRFPPTDAATQVFSLDSAETGWFHQDRIQKNNSSYGDTATYPWTVDQSMELYGTPRVDVTFDVHGPEAIVYFHLLHDGTAIHGYGDAYRLEGAGTRHASFEFPTLQRSLAAGDELALEITVTKQNYMDSDVSDGVTVNPVDSFLDVPARVDGGTGTGSDGSDGSTGGSSGWWGSDGSSGSGATSGSSGSGWLTGAGADSGGSSGTGSSSDSGSGWW